MEHLCPTVMRHARQMACLAPEERDDGYAFLQANPEALLLRIGKHEIDAKGLVGEGTRSTDFCAYLLERRPAECKHSQTTGVANCCSKAWRGRSTHCSLNDRHTDPNKDRKRIRH